MAPVDRMIADLLARWVAETRRGSIRELRAKIAWAARTSDIGVTAVETGRWVRDLSSLGHAELDWRSDTWTAAPLVVTRLPGPDGLAMLVGARSAAVDAAISKLDVEVHRIAQPGGDRQLDRPTAILLQYDRLEDLHEIAAALGATYVPCAARQLAAILPAPRLGQPAAPPSNFNDTLERFDPNALRWLPQSPLASHIAGLYRFENLGRKQHLHFDLSSGWRHCDLSAGVFAELRRTGKTVMRWRPDPEASRQGQGHVFTDWGAPLPPLHQRALVLCTGWVPRFSEGAETAIYDNVPRQVAELVAASLGQQLGAA